MIDRNRDLDQASQRPPERRFLGWLLFPIALFPLIALLTYDWRTQDQTPPAASSNWFGPMGDMFAYYGYKIFGLAIWIVPLFCIWGGCRLVLSGLRRPGAKTLWTRSWPRPPRPSPGSMPH